MRAFIKVVHYHFPLTVGETYEIDPKFINDVFISVYVARDENYYSVPRAKVISYNTEENPEYFL